METLYPGATSVLFRGESCFFSLTLRRGEVTPGKRNKKHTSPIPHTTYTRNKMDKVYEQQYKRVRGEEKEEEAEEEDEQEEEDTWGCLADAKAPAEP